MTYPVIKTSPDKLSEASRENFGVIYEPNVHSFTESATWATFSGYNPDRELITAGVNFFPGMGRIPPCWFATMAIKHHTGLITLICEDHGTYTNALARLHEMLASVQAVPGRQRFVN